MRAASPGREPRCSLLAKERPASLCSDASCNRELPLSPSSPLRARTPSCFAEPALLSASASAAPTQPPRPLCPQLFAGSRLILSALFRAEWQAPHHLWAQLRSARHRPIPAVYTCPSTSAPARPDPGWSPLPCCSAESPGGGAGLPSQVQLLCSYLLSGFQALLVFYGPFASCLGERSQCKPPAFSAGAADGRAGLGQLLAAAVAAAGARGGAGGSPAPLPAL